MARRDSKGRFIKGGGKRRASSSRAITVRRSSSPAAPRRRRRSGGGGIASGSPSFKSLGPPLIAAAAMGAIIKRSKSGGLAAQVVDLAKKVPGQKTFGTAPAIGVIALWIDRFLYRHRYLRLAGVVGLIIGAYDAGGTQDLKWLGSVGDADDGMVAS